LIITLQQVDGEALLNTPHLGQVAPDRLRGQVPHGHHLRRLLALFLVLEYQTAISGWALLLLQEDTIGLDPLVLRDGPLILEVVLMVVMVVAAAILLDLEILLISEFPISYMISKSHSSIFNLFRRVVEFI
jgi:hypothetical protein